MKASIYCRLCELWHDFDQCEYIEKLDLHLCFKCYNTVIEGDRWN